MAPRKEKTDKPAVEDKEAMVLKYLKQQNRPYSAIDVSANLHNKVTKAQSTKLLKDLHDRKEISCRVSGKQSVYHSLQLPPASTNSSTANDESSPTSHHPSLESLAAEITSLHSHLSSLKSTTKTLKTTLTSLTPTIASIIDLERRLTDLTHEKSLLQNQIKTLTSQIAQDGSSTTTAHALSEKEMEEMKAEHHKWKRHAKLRREICRDVFLKVADAVLGQEEDYSVADPNPSQTEDEKEDSVGGGGGGSGLRTTQELWEMLGLEGQL